MKELPKNIPQKIYLQAGIGVDETDNFGTFSEVTWSRDRCFHTDIPFVLQSPSADESAKRKDELIEKMADQKAFFESIRFVLDEKGVLNLTDTEIHISEIIDEALK